jgi:hypothetical protein
MICTADSRELISVPVATVECSLFDSRQHGASRRTAAGPIADSCGAANHLCKAAQALDEDARDDHNPGDQCGQAGKHQKVIQDIYHPAPPCF